MPPVAVRLVKSEMSILVPCQVPLVTMPELPTWKPAPEVPTVKREAGVVVPMPTLPEEAMNKEEVAWRAEAVRPLKT